MKIDVYGKYKVIQKSKASVRAGEDEFEEQSFEQTYESMEGSELLNWIAELTRRNNIVSIEIKGNKILLDEFNSCTGEDGDVSLTITELTEPKISTSLDKTHRIYISKNNREEFFEEIFTLEKQGEDISYYFTPDYLEQICLGDTGADDKKYSQIIKLLKKEYKEYARDLTNDYGRFND